MYTIPPVTVENITGATEDKNYEGHFILFDYLCNFAQVFNLGEGGLL